jgi:hypothetical protein
VGVSGKRRNGMAPEDELFLMELNLHLIQDYPGGRETMATHFRCMLPRDSHSGHLETEFVREFPSLPRVEDIAVTPEGSTFYVTDEDEGVHLRLTRLLAG